MYATCKFQSPLPTLFLSFFIITSKYFSQSSLRFSDHADWTLTWLAICSSCKISLKYSWWAHDNFSGCFIVKYLRFHDEGNCKETYLSAFSTLRATMASTTTTTFKKLDQKIDIGPFLWTCELSQCKGVGGGVGAVLRRILLWFFSRPRSRDFQKYSLRFWKI